MRVLARLYIYTSTGIYKHRRHLPAERIHEETQNTLARMFQLRAREARGDTASAGTHAPRKGTVCTCTTTCSLLLQIRPAAPTPLEWAQAQGKLISHEPL